MRFAASRAADEARWDERYTAQLRQREAIDRQRRSEARRRANAEARARRETAGRQAAERRAAEREAAFLARDQLYQQNLIQFAALLAEIRSRYPDLAVQIDAFRRSITEFVETASAERLALLRQYIDGDRRAFALLRQLTQIENAARTAAAESARASARRQNADAQRVLGLIALNELNRYGDGLETAIQIWRDVLQEDARRLDHLVLARLWMLAANDLRRSEEIDAANALPDDPEMNGRYPLAAAFVAVTDGQPGSIVTGTAELLRHPPPAGAIGFEQQPNIPAPDIRLAPLLENYGACEQSIAAADHWTLVRDTADSDRRVRELAGSQAVGEPVQPPSGERPSLNCGLVAENIVQLMSDPSIAPLHKEAILAESFDLAEEIRSHGQEDVAATIWRATASFCEERTPAEPLSAMLQVSCVRARLFTIARQIDGGRAISADEVTTVIHRLHGVRADGFPAPPLAFLLPNTYGLGVAVLERAGNASAAFDLIRQARRVLANVMEPVRQVPVYQLLDLAFANEEARLATLGQSLETIEAVLQRTQGSVVDFLASHPHSLGGCNLLRQRIAIELAWRIARPVDGSIPFLNRVSSALEGCDRLNAAIFGAVYFMPAGLLLRQELVLRLADARFQSGDLREARIAFEYLRELGAGSSSPSNSFITQVSALAALSQIARREGRLADAAERESQAAEIARAHHRPTYLIGHLGNLGGLQTLLGNSAAAEAAFVEKLRLCATQIEVLPRNGDGPIDRILQSLTASQCDGSFGEAPAFFERSVSAVEALPGDAPNRVLALADALFFLGVALEADLDDEGARAAYRRSLSLRRGEALRFAALPAHQDLTPYVLARLAALAGEEGNWPALVRLLEERARMRPLASDEERLLDLARRRARASVRH